MSRAVPGLEIVNCETREAALASLPGTPACFGTLDPELLTAATELKWLAAPMAGPPKGYYFKELIESDIVVTNFRGIFNDHISAHIMAFVLVFARRMNQYFHDQPTGKWRIGGETRTSTHLPDSTALIIGVGGVGGATARQCKNWGMTVIGVDPRVSEAPDGVDELHRPEALDTLLPNADFVILTAPQTAETEGLFDGGKFDRMKESAYFINIGRGSNVKLGDLENALRKGSIAGAGLDVFEIEPLPPEHPLRTAPNFLMTPHVAASGPYLEERRAELLKENAKRFEENRELVNIVDKANGY
jgi:phosphoglycerate dehydrogenase-like enzyme